MAIEVRYNFPKRIVLTVAVFTVESAQRAIMLDSVVVKAGTCLRAA